MHFDHSFLCRTFFYICFIWIWCVAAILRVIFFFRLLQQFFSLCNPTVFDHGAPVGPKNLPLLKQEAFVAVFYSDKENRLQFPVFLAVFSWRSTLFWPKASFRHPVSMTISWRLLLLCSVTSGSIRLWYLSMCFFRWSSVTKNVPFRFNIILKEFCWCIA